MFIDFRDGSLTSRELHANNRWVLLEPSPVTLPARGVSNAGAKRGMIMPDLIFDCKPPVGKIFTALTVAARRALTAYGARFPASTSSPRSAARVALD